MVTSTAMPLYHQIKEDLVESIKGGDLTPGDRIESEPELMDRYHVSRATVRQALGQLVAEGYLVIRRGLGTYVAEPKIQQGLLGMYSFSREIERLGMRPGTHVQGLGVEPAGPFVAAALEIPNGEPVVVLRRLRTADDEPMMLETSWLPDRRFPGLADRDLEHQRLYDVLIEAYGVRPSRAREEFEPVLLSSDDARLLGKRPSDPALLLERIAYDPEGRPIEFCRSLVRGDRCRYFVELRSL